MNSLNFANGTKIARTWSKDTTHRQGGRIAMTSSPLQTEIAAYEQIRSDLEAHHAGKFVVIYGPDLIGAFDTFDNAAREAVARFGRGPYLIRQVGAQPPPMPASVMYRPVMAGADR